jgi:hypothetical protein
VTWRTYAFTFMLAEGDNGGFPGFVTDIYKEVQVKTQEKIATYVKEGSPIGTGRYLRYVPNIVNAVLDEVLKWLSDCGKTTSSRQRPRTSAAQQDAGLQQRVHGTKAHPVFRQVDHQRPRRRLPRTDRHRGWSAGLAA